MVSGAREVGRVKWGSASRGLSVQRGRFCRQAGTSPFRLYRRRVRQCDEIGEYGMAEHLRNILVQEQDHQIALATALGVDIPDVTQPDQRA